MTVMILDQVKCRLFVENLDHRVHIFILQFGIGMLDARTSMQMLESEKRKEDASICGGHYGLGLKQLLATFAGKDDDGWVFEMYGS